MPDQQQMENKKFFLCCQLPYGIRINRANVQFVYGGNLVFVRSFVHSFFSFYFSPCCGCQFVFNALCFSHVQWCLLCSILWKWRYTCSIFFVYFHVPNSCCSTENELLCFMLTILLAIQFHLRNETEFSKNWKMKRKTSQFTFRMWMANLWHRPVLYLYLILILFHPIFPYSILNRTFACEMWNSEPKHSLPNPDGERKVINSIDSLRFHAKHK